MLIRWYFVARYIHTYVGLLSYLLKQSLFNLVEDDLESSIPTVSSFHYIPHDSFLRIDQFTLLGLHVFVDDSPLIITENRHKEGHSLFSVLNRVCSTFNIFIIA